MNTILKPLTLGLALTAAVVLTACGTSATHSSSSGAQSPPAQAQSAARDNNAAPDTTVAPPKRAVAPVASPSASSSTNDIPFYGGARVVRDTYGSTQLKSDDSVGQVSAFYADALDRGKWHFVSKSVTPWSGSFVVRKGSQGASISVYRTGLGGGASVSISRYPV